MCIDIGKLSVGNCYPYLRCEIFKKSSRLGAVFGAVNARLTDIGKQCRGGVHTLIDWGVDGIVTDRPDLLREVLQAHGMWTSSLGT